MTKAQLIPRQIVIINSPMEETNAMLTFGKPFYPLAFWTLQSNPEQAHQQLIKILNRIDRSRHSWAADWLLSQLENSFCQSDPRLVQNLWGLTFNNPLGLAAGFDKDGLAAGTWASFGFGLAELGAVTHHPQPGNPRPRLFRLPQDRAGLNRMGANNQGAKVMAKTLQETWARHPRTIPIGINLCKSKITPLDAAALDYVESFRYLKDWADYFVVNVSSPNTPGLRDLQATEQLEPIIAALQAENGGTKPILVKISPDLNWSDLADLVQLAKTYQLAGIIATNTTISREGLKTQILKATGKDIREEAGGISGMPLQKRSTEIIRFIWQQTGGQLPIIGVGGIFTPLDAWEKIAAGASLLQVYTGWIYEGPWMVPNILQGLVAKLEEHGLSSLSEAVGCENKQGVGTRE
uniref:Dihydroorotate dehydrogenase (quinone) n=2 Tax=Gloeothece TaxID=28070 RepID=E0U849_GLOV7|nr:dihydroorotate dehydrogenase [Gloeothece verrucosa PCC 7822]